MFNLALGSDTAHFCILKRVHLLTTCSLVTARRAQCRAAQR